MSAEYENSQFYSPSSISFPGGLDLGKSTWESTNSSSNVHSVSPSQLYYSVYLYFGFMIIGWSIFHFVSRRASYDDLYRTRKRSPEFTNPFVEKEYNGFVDWVSDLLSVNDDDILQYCGLDTLMFLRFNKLCLRVSFCAVATSFVLFPVYATSSNEQRDILQTLTVGNLKDSDPKLIWPMLCYLFLCIFAIVLLCNEYMYYTGKRHQMLQQDSIEHYSVIYHDLPESLRSIKPLRRELNKIFPNQIRCVYVAADVEDVENLVAKREHARLELEHALALEAKSGSRPKHNDNPISCICCNPCGKTVDSIDYFKQKLDELNFRVKLLIEHFEICLSENEHENNCETVTDDALPDVSMRSAAIVTFGTLQAAQMAQQMQMETTSYSKPFEMRAEAAPSVEDIYWPNIGRLSQVQTRYWSLVSHVATYLLVIFWSIPTAFVGALSSVDSLKAKLPFLKKIVQNNHWLVGILQQLSPLLLALMVDVIAPLIFKILSRLEGHVSDSKLGASLLSKLAIFQLVQTFFIASVSGSVFQALNDILDKPSVAATLLGETIPGQATFYMMFLTIQTGIGPTLEILRVTPALLSVLHRCIAPSLTNRERRSSWYFLVPASIPGTFNPISKATSLFLSFLLVLVFAPLAPLIGIFTLFYFFTIEVVSRRQALFIYDPTHSSGGVFWPKLYSFSIVALVISQLCLAGVLGVKKYPQASGIAMITVITLLAHQYVTRAYPEMSKYLPLKQCIEVDNERGEHFPYSRLAVHDQNNATSTHFGPYVQPALTLKEPISPLGNDSNC